MYYIEVILNDVKKYVEIFNANKSEWGLSTIKMSLFTTREEATKNQVTR